MKKQLRATLMAGSILMASIAAAPGVAWAGSLDEGLTDPEVIAPRCTILFGLLPCHVDQPYEYRGGDGPELRVAPMVSKRPVARPPAQSKRPVLRPSRPARPAPDPIEQDDEEDDYDEC